MAFEKVLLLGLAVIAIGAIAVWSDGIVDEADEAVAFAVDELRELEIVSRELTE